MRQRDLRFTFAVLSSHIEFDVVAFTLEEALSEPFRLELELSSYSTAIDFAQVLDCPALLTIWHGNQAVRYVHGLVSAFTQGTTGFHRTRYRAVVEPQLCRLALCSNWRIFQQKSVPAILKNVLREHGILHYEQHLTNENLVREYCVQAGDSDLYLLDRLAAEEGFYYSFSFTADSHTLHHGDRLYIHPRIEGDPVLYNDAPAGDAPQPVLYAFSYTENVRTAQQTQRDYTFKRPSYSQHHNVAGEELEHQAQTYERYDYPGRYKTSSAGKPFTQNRLRGHRRDARVALVEGDDPRLIPGVGFQLTGHPRPDFNRWWRPVRITHKGVQNASQEDEAAEVGVSYDYVAEIISEDTEWRPEPMPKPSIEGPQIATVVGPESEEIYCDEWGRVKVQFPWDREGEHNEFSSCWIRVAHNWAGVDWGHIAIPRIGQEVIVDYLDGDCDQPIITGRTYRATNPPPYELPRHKTRMTIKSKTHKGEGFNELRFEDEKDQEEIYVHAQKDQNIHVNHDETTYVGHDRSEQVENDETIAIGHDRRETVGNDEQVTIGRDRRHNIGQDDFLTIGRNHTVHTGKDRTEEVGNNRRDKTIANHWIEIGGHREEAVQGHHRIEAGQSIERRTQRYELKSSSSVVIKGPGGSITIDESGITLDGIAIRFKGAVNHSSSGNNNPFAVVGTPASGKPLDRLCGKRPDGTCLLEDCTCLKGSAK